MEYDLSLLYVLTDDIHSPFFMIRKKERSLYGIRNVGYFTLFET